jgi:hypothetical protein
MPNRFTTPLHRNSLKTHVRRLIALLGGIEAAATVTRVGRSRLAEYADVHAQDRHMPIDILLDLELAAGDPLVTAQLAAAQGYVINPLQFGEGDVAEALARVSKDAGTTLSDAVQAIRDGLPADERIKLVADLTELQRAAQAALGALGAAPPGPRVVGAA